MILWLLLSLSAVAWETDNFHCRYQELEDVSSQLNAEVNRRINHVLTHGGPGSQENNGTRIFVQQFGIDNLEAHEKKQVDEMIKDFMRDSGIESFSKAKRIWLTVHPSQDSRFTRPVGLRGCVKSELLGAMHAALASAWFGNMETWAQEQSFSKCIPEKTVYDGFGVTDAMVLSAVGLNYVIRVGEHRIGVDKLSHFMTEGFDYYQAQENGSDMEAILDIGKREEEGVYGWSSTGIKSYGDLAANYHGYLFWKNLVDGDDPYIKCENGQWKQVKPFNWLSFVNSSFDESINCSQFKTEEMQKIVDENVKKLQISQNKSTYQCPLETGKCSGMSRVIANSYVRSQIIHPRCSTYDSQSVNQTRGTGSGTR